MCDTEHLLFAFEVIDGIWIYEKQNSIIRKLWISQTVKSLKNPQKMYC